MPFKLFDFLERFMIGAFLITLTQIDKTGSTIKVIVLLENKKVVFTIFCTISTFVFAECYLHNFDRVILVKVKLCIFN